MLHDGRTEQVEADDVIAELSAKVGDDRLCDFDGSELDPAFSEAVARKG